MSGEKHVYGSTSPYRTMDPYRESNKEKKLPFNFKMLLKAWGPFVVGTLVALMVILFVGAVYHVLNERMLEIKFSNEKFISFMEAKCSPGFYTEIKNVRDNIYRLKCSTENGKENEIVIKYPEEIK